MSLRERTLVMKNAVAGVESRGDHWMCSRDDPFGERICQRWAEKEETGHLK
jgi:hypothetical protein